MKIVSESIADYVDLNYDIHFFDDIKELCHFIEEAVANIVPTYTPQNIKPKGEKEL